MEVCPFDKGGFVTEHELDLLACGRNPLLDEAVVDMSINDPGFVVGS